MKFSILFTVLACNYNVIFGYPGIVESNIDLKKIREKKTEPITFKLPSYNNINSNTIINDEKINEKFTSSSSSSAQDSSFHPIQLTREDVVSGIQSSSSYGPSTITPSITSGGVIFAISRGHESTSSPLLASSEIAGQPVLMQYISPEGQPQTAVSYIQLLRPIMMVPARPYLPAQPVTLPTKPTTTPIIPTTIRPMAYSFFPRDDSHFSPLSSYRTTATSQHSREYLPKHSKHPDIDFNMNEYLPAASSQSFSAVLPSPTMVSPYPQFRPQLQPQFRRFAQRA